MHPSIRPGIIPSHSIRITGAWVKRHDDWLNIHQVFQWYYCGPTTVVVCPKGDQQLGGLPARTVYTRASYGQTLW